jgi:hypothetical protein|tara:strand:+ start:99 stop:491 length:393 start_codon:yes stop_codon:yes gene_type:complete
MSKVTVEQMEQICNRLMDGESLTQICDNTANLPSKRTIYRHVQSDEKAWEMYSKARAIQGEDLEDRIMDIINEPLPSDPKIAMATVQYKRLKVDALDKRKRQLQPLGGIRNKPEDLAPQVSGTIKLSWNE